MKKSQPTRPSDTRINKISKCKIPEDFDLAVPGQKKSSLLKKVSSVENDRVHEQAIFLVKQGKKKIQLDSSRTIYTRPIAQTCFILF